MSMATAGLPSAAMESWSSTPSRPRWYVAHNGAGHDERAKRILEDSGYETYVPMTAEMKVTPQRKLSAKQRRSLIPVVKRVLRPLFPRYFFVQFDLEQEGWAGVFERAGLHGVLAVPGSTRRLPAEVHAGVIAGLKGQEVNGAIPAETRIQQVAYAIGEQVRISTGAFVGHNGTVDECPKGALCDLDESASVRLLVSLFGRQSVVEMSIFDIEKL